MTSNADEQSDFRARRSTTEHIFNLRTINEKYMQHQHNMHCVIIKFRMAFNRVWYEILWATMRNVKLMPASYSLSKNLFYKFCSIAELETGSEILSGLE